MQHPWQGLNARVCVQECHEIRGMLAATQPSLSYLPCQARTRAEGPGHLPEREWVSAGTAATPWGHRDLRATHLKGKSIRWSCTVHPEPATQHRNLPQNHFFEGKEQGWVTGFRWVMVCGCLMRVGCCTNWGTSGLPGTGSDPGPVRYPEYPDQLLRPRQQHPAECKYIRLFLPHCLLLSITEINSVRLSCEHMSRAMKHQLSWRNNRENCSSPV